VDRRHPRCAGEGAGGLGDNLIGHTWTASSQIRVEIALYDYTGPQLTGVNMTVLYGSGTTEMQGTDGTTGPFAPAIYAVTPRLVVQKLDDVTREPVAEVVNASIADGFSASESQSKFAAEVNVSGKIVFGYNLNIGSVPLPAGVQRTGWWRISFQLDNSAVVGGVTVNRNVAWVDINVTN